jgi:hypothetical protein
MSKKSGDCRCWSRVSSKVVRCVTSTVPEIDGCSPPAIVPPKTGARPFTVARPRCLIWNSTVEWEGSIDQVPAGMTVTGSSARMGMALL